MFDKLKSILAKVRADYSDVRYEIKRETKIGFSGKELTLLVSSDTDGYVLRAVADGGMATTAFTRFEDAEKAAKTVVENARLVAGRARRRVELAKTDVVKETYLPELKEDPRKVPIEEKLALVRAYNDIPLKNEKVSTTDIAYVDTVREKHFASSEGSEIHEDLVTTRVAGVIVTKEGNLVQTTRVGVGGSDGMARARNREDEFERRTKLAVDLLKAEPVKGGTHRVVLDQRLAGVFTHEAFGHFSEADLIEDSPTMREKMKLGAKLGNDVVNIKDDPTMPGQLGFYKYDDEGVRARPVQLMKAGVLVGRLHSRRTAAAFGEPLSGHCVAEDYRYAPIIRMGNIYIEPSDKKLEELLAMLGNGLYLLNAMGGQTSGENFTFGAQYGYVVKDGKPGQMVRDINIGGNLYQTLENITAVGNDLKLGEIGGCGKGQLNIRSCHGAPHVLVKSVVVGGR